MTLAQLPVLGGDLILLLATVLGELVVAEQLPDALLRLPGKVAEQAGARAVTLIIVGHPQVMPDHATAHTPLSASGVWVAWILEARTGQVL